MSIEKTIFNDYEGYAPAEKVLEAAVADDTIFFDICLHEEKAAPDSVWAALTLLNIAACAIFGSAYGYHSFHRGRRL